MKNGFTCTLARLTLAAFTSFTHVATAADEIDIDRPIDVLGWTTIPVNLSGFTGEAESVLRLDLTFMGFKFVPTGEAKFLITGSNAGRIECRVIEKFNNQQRLGKAYTGGTTRSQVHALADDIAKELTGKPGIAQTKIAFKVERAGNSEVYIGDYDGFNAQGVTQDGSLVAAPTWMGHQSLLYASYKLGRLQVFTHELTTGARRAAVRVPGSSMSPAASPDGRRVAMILNKGGNPDLYVCDADGSDLKQLTNTREAESSPCWSPDGQRICFVSRERGPASLYVVPATGGSMRRITTAGVPNATEPDWSPDGKWIVFTTLQRQFSLCLVKAEGGEATVLVEGEDPSWAPNSRAVIFCKGPDKSKVLSVLDVPTRRIKTIARISDSNSQPSWAR